MCKQSNDYFFVIYNAIIGDLYYRNLKKKKKKNKEIEAKWIDFICTPSSKEPSAQVQVQAPGPSPSHIPNQYYNSRQLRKPNSNNLLMFSLVKKKK